MHIVSMALVTLVSLEFMYIFYLETIATTSSSTGRVFGMTHEELSRDSVTTLFRNQGVYNLLIGVLLLIALFAYHSQAAVAWLLGYIIAVAAYGSYTSSPWIILKQGGIAIVALVFTLVFGV